MHAFVLYLLKEWAVEDWGTPPAVANALSTVFHIYFQTWCPDQKVTGDERQPVLKVPKPHRQVLCVSKLGGRGHQINLQTYV